MPYDKPPPPKPAPPKPQSTPSYAPPEPQREPGAAGEGSFVLGMIAAIVAGALGIGIWAGLYKLGLMTNNNLPPVPWWSLMLNSPLVGVVVGLSARLMGRSRDIKVAVTAIIATVLGCFIGYVMVDLYLLKWSVNGVPVQPGFGDAAGRFFNDVMKVLLTAIGCWIAFAVSRPSTNAQANS